jgi:hypothetical protein
MCPVYYVNDVTGLHPDLTFPFKGRMRIALARHNVFYFSPATR